MRNSQKRKIETEFDKRSLPGLLVFFVLLAVGLGLFFFWRSKRQETEVTEEEEIVVAATIFPIYDITRNIIGDDGSFEVVQIVPSDQNPESYQLTVDPSAELGTSSLQLDSKPEIVVEVGAGFDDWVDDGFPDTKMVDLSQEVELIKIDKNGIETDSPYYWLSIENAKKISEKIFEELAVLHPESEGVLRSNLEQYLGELDETKTDDSSKLSATSFQLITYRGNLVYFAQENDIEVLVTFEDYVDQEVPAEYLAELEQLMSENGINTIYIDSFTDESVIQNLAWDKVVGIRKYDIYGGTNEDDSYIDVMESLINQIVTLE